MQISDFENTKEVLDLTCKIGSIVEEKLAKEGESPHTQTIVVTSLARLLCHLLISSGCTLDEFVRRMTSSFIVCEEENEAFNKLKETP